MRWGIALAAFAWGCGSSSPGITGDAGAAVCGSCHTTEYAAWSTSRLRTSGTSPVFAALSASVAESWGEDARARCVTCHQPGFGGDHGIGCVACHSATGNIATRDGLLTVDLEAPVSGPFADPISTPAHGSRTYGFLTSPQLCGTCHEVTGPRLFHETTVDEFDDSIASGRGTGCVSCHMPDVASGPIALGEENTRPRKDHSFVGIDPPWGAAQGIAQMAASRTLALLRSGLGVVAARSGEGLEITVANVAGHAVPTGITILRSIWVDVEWTGKGGETAITPSVIVLGSQPTLKGAPVALITEADAVASHVLAPGATTTAHVDAPPSLALPVSAVVKLRARAVRTDVLDALGLASLGGEVPTHEVAVVTVP
jgi:hypothetical protein